ncbi:hypothetical protein HHX47_DHR2000342 [Lentinula edodes]|nr:hypothetical protein HHX47_DHR2000342 [Lentinula edodes]
MPEQNLRKITLERKYMRSWRQNISPGKAFDAPKNASSEPHDIGEVIDSLHCPWDLAINSEREVDNRLGNAGLFDQNQTAKDRIDKLY